jgi:uncharacterized protein YigA (DUF484 family)
MRHTGCDLSYPVAAFYEQVAAVMRLLSHPSSSLTQSTCRAKNRPCGRLSKAEADDQLDYNEQRAVGSAACVAPRSELGAGTVAFSKA